MSLKKNIIRVLFANFFTAIIGLLTGLIIPALLPLDSYSDIKTYMLYVSYIGLLHFGFIDGMYIKYGGKDIKEIDKNILKGEHNIFLAIEMVMTLVIIMISILMKNKIILLLAISIIPTNIVSFHNLFYQSTGQFKKFAFSSYLYSAIYLILNIILLFFVKSKNYVPYCIAGIIANTITGVYLEYNFVKKNLHLKSVYMKSQLNNIKVGIIILFANLSLVLFYGIDRWFVKIFYDNKVFAYYSFAISLLTLINIFINAISIIFYNYLAKDEDKEKLVLLKRYFVILGGLASGLYFVLAIIVRMFMPKYIASLSIIAISFSAYPYLIILNTLYLNLYKARKNEKVYIKVVVRILLVSIIYNLIAVLLIKDSRSVAIATTLSVITWYLLSERDFPYLKDTIKDKVYLIVLLILFLIFSHISNLAIGAMIYLLGYLILTSIIYNIEIINIKDRVKLSFIQLIKRSKIYNRA